MIKQLKRLNTFVKFLQQFTLLGGEQGEQIVFHRRSGIMIHIKGDGSVAFEAAGDISIDGRTLQLQCKDANKENEEANAGQAEGGQTLSERYYSDCLGVGADGGEIEGGRPLSAHVSG